MKDLSIAEEEIISKEHFSKKFEELEIILTDTVNAYDDLREKDKQIVKYFDDIQLSIIKIIKNLERESL